MSTGLLQPVGYEPHIQEPETADPQILERTWGLLARVDPSVTFEEYQYWAKIEREEEVEANRAFITERGPMSFAKLIKGRFSKGVHHDNAKKQKKLDAQNANVIDAVSADEPTAPAVGEKSDDPDHKAVVKSEKDSELPSAFSKSQMQQEWKTAARALRTASWGTVFYLMTTDILGWSTAPFVFASVGYGTGIALYIVFGVFAFISGWILWKVFLGLDSSRYPMVSYGDTFFRVYGTYSRHFINFSQALEQFLTVAVLILANAQLIAQINGEHICFIVTMVIAMAVGLVLGSVRSLQRLGWICNLSVWLNVATFLMILVACSHYGVDWQAATASTLLPKSLQPIKTFGGIPPDAYQQQAPGFAGEFNGINSMRYVRLYSSVVLVSLTMVDAAPDGLLERPDLRLWLHRRGVRPLRTVLRIEHHASHSAIWRPDCREHPESHDRVHRMPYVLPLPPLPLPGHRHQQRPHPVVVPRPGVLGPGIRRRRGRAEPQRLDRSVHISFDTLKLPVSDTLTMRTGLVGALLILNFTYSFPAILYVGYRIQEDAALPGEGFDPATRVTTRHDAGLKRWWRGFKVNWHINCFNIFYALGGLACSGMGAWAAIEGLIAVFGEFVVDLRGAGCMLMLNQGLEGQSPHRML
ncbi:hypothetical protein MRB53_038254 [Persea americana]|nr:hypothetical protein MRB53_038254 [Persea americana]